VTASKDFFKKFPGDIWVETGTYFGDGIAQALDAGFERIISIELSKSFYEDAVKRFLNNKNVQIINARAHDVLFDVLNDLPNEKIVFWLDAHYSMCGTAGEDDPNPILKELDAIKRWKKSTNSQTPTILIDDMRTFTYDNCGFSEKEILAALSEIDVNYQFRKEDGMNENFLNDVLVASVS
jgi:hypothetical protein